MASSRILCKAVFAIVATFCVLFRSTFCDSSPLSFPQPTNSILGLPTPLPVNNTAHRPVLSRLNIKHRLKDIRSTREISRESIEEVNAIIMVSFPYRVKKNRDYDQNQLLQFLGNNTDFAQVKFSFVKDNLHRLRQRHKIIRIEYEEQLSTATDTVSITELSASLWRSVIDLFKKGMGVLRNDKEIERQKFKTWFNNNVLKVLNQEGKTLTESQLYT